ncbi:MAG: hypothetical protein ABL923_02325 [Burkholderiaceae bacterium]
MQNLSNFRTDKRLLDAVQAAAVRRSPHEMFEQKVSFVFGSIQRNSMTKEQVREVMLKQAGEPIPAR